MIFQPLWNGKSPLRGPKSIGIQKSKNELMKTSEINRCIKNYLLPYLKGYEVYKDVMYKIAPELFLKGYSVETSGNGEYDISVAVFIQPLFVKSDSLLTHFGVNLCYKKKAGKFKTLELQWWDASRENLEASF